MTEKPAVLPKPVRDEAGKLVAGNNRKWENRDTNKLHIWPLTFRVEWNYLQAMTFDVTLTDVQSDINKAIKVMYLFQRNILSNCLAKREDKLPFHYSWRSTCTMRQFVNSFQLVFSLTMVALVIDEVSPEPKLTRLNWTTRPLDAVTIRLKKYQLLRATPRHILNRLAFGLVETCYRSRRELLQV